MSKSICRFKMTKSICYEALLTRGRAELPVVLPVNAELDPPARNAGFISDYNRRFDPASH
jgi:hypothetical protein